MPQNRDLVVIGGSAGGLEPLRKIVEDLPVDLGAAVFAVLHMPATGGSIMAALLDRIGGLRAVTPRDGDPIRPGYLYAAVPDHHLLIEDGRIRLDRSPRVNGVRPAVDVLFKSAAQHGQRVIGVVLSGGLDDGSAGLAAIRAAGGIGIVQAPADAGVSGMPLNAIERAEPEHVIPAADIGSLIGELVGSDSETGRPLAPGGKEAVEAVGADDSRGEVTGITCPDCHGSIWVRQDEGKTTFACRIGHEFAPETFLDRQVGSTEDALWAGVRSLEEQASLSLYMANLARRRGDAEAAARHERRAHRSEGSSAALRALLTADEEPAS